jgi:hypothetical protein
VAGRERVRDHHLHVSRKPAYSNVASVPKNEIVPVMIIVRMTDSMIVRHQRRWAK